ncbi:hypothetical protein IE81DRAFT_348169 [Ceraceosorus guamensis]|uniref:Uncharacterized protein n=1 Tax=Ceraceosorus guamensis TaxID=1522189 RepID=A0A316VWB8_9BASI|nr:hypothetical protein IE81DRAFT_348169 [Ceraceosorus guamensis]PWN41594.1 hypothetical protein IE81DRAFT_348169 [Ceraceosorus guamensis]
MSRAQSKASKLANDCVQQLMSNEQAIKQWKEWTTVLPNVGKAPVRLGRHFKFLALIKQQGAHYLTSPVTRPPYLLQHSQLHLVQQKHKAHFDKLSWLTIQRTESDILSEHDKIIEYVGNLSITEEEHNTLVCMTTSAQSNVAKLANNRVQQLRSNDLEVKQWREWTSVLPNVGEALVRLGRHLKFSNLPAEFTWLFSGTLSKEIRAVLRKLLAGCDNLDSNTDLEAARNLIEDIDSSGDPLQDAPKGSKAISEAEVSADFGELSTGDDAVAADGLAVLRAKAIASRARFVATGKAAATNTSTGPTSPSTSAPSTATSGTKRQAGETPLLGSEAFAKPKVTARSLTIKGAGEVVHTPTQASATASAGHDTPKRGTTSPTNESA